jgi:group I intron endonuclease
MAGIYKITSPSGSVYIGQTLTTFQKRWSYYYRLKCGKQPKLFASLNKYGPLKHHFEIIEEFSDPIRIGLIDAYEEAIYNEYVAAGYNMLNTRMPGCQPRHSQETINKLQMPVPARHQSLRVLLKV